MRHSTNVKPSWRAICWIIFELTVDATIANFSVARPSTPGRTTAHIPTKWLSGSFPGAQNPCGEHCTELISRKGFPDPTVTSVKISEMKDWPCPFSTYDFSAAANLSESGS